ncbi:ORF6N domain-containing protein [Sinorhizobium sp. RAC02]|uniref:ORF6N domain-containing protein n=1 Tax=Sinorhizobium sp. RAC02 TaxID=1842534 RepID=UPI00083D10D0|nr:ORF6N domain-containing protein [Sinorhizobium sp. RAC02]AOF91235.1 hypothetical protein BSY16_3980 [Sinorhizobium sp. RAC02]
MNATVNIHGTELAITAFNGVRVLTTERLAKVFGATETQVINNFDRNASRFDEGKHFFKVEGEELRALKDSISFRGSVGKQAKSLLLWTDRGASRHAKILDTDMAWEVYGELEESYFANGRGTASLPNFSDPVIAARAWADEREARQIAERTKAQIGSRREATAMNAASQAVKKIKKLEIELDRSLSCATVKRMEDHYGRVFPWRPLKKAAEALGVLSENVADANYGTVKAYHAEVWREVYGVEIPHPE